MIELVSDERCVRCGICVKVCPTNVFDAVAGEAPVIARQHDCQTCFMCELYCPADALFVAPEAEQRVDVNETRLSERGLLGSYRAAVGWGPGRSSSAVADESFRVLAPNVELKTRFTRPADPSQQDPGLMRHTCVATEVTGGASSLVSTHMACAKPHVF